MTETKDGERAAGPAPAPAKASPRRVKEPAPVPAAPVAAEPALWFPRPEGYALKDSDQDVLYGYMRQEVEREDRLTHERLTTLCAFQGFLMAGAALLISSGWPVDMPVVTLLRKIIIFGTGFMGLIVAWASHIAIHASRKSLDNAKKRWSEVTEEITLDPRFPQAHGQRNVFFTGSLVAHMVPLGFVMMWAGYLIVCFILVLTAHQDTLRLLPVPAADWFSGVIGALASADVSGPA